MLAAALNQLNVQCARQTVVALHLREVNARQNGEPSRHGTHIDTRPNSQRQQSTAELYRNRQRMQVITRRNLDSPADFESYFHFFILFRLQVRYFLRKVLVSYFVRKFKVSLIININTKYKLN